MTTVINYEHANEFIRHNNSKILNRKAFNWVKENMTTQVICYGSTTTTEKYSATEEYGAACVTYSPLNAPRAIDDFDIVIVDLSGQKMWSYSDDVIGKINSYRDLDTIRKMVYNKKKAIVLYVLPQNIQYKYHMRYASTGSYKVEALKDILEEVQKHTINAVTPNNAAMPQLAYEKTNSIISGHEYSADLYFVNPEPEVVRTISEKSEKPTTVEIGNQIYATTLDITKSSEKLIQFISAQFNKSEQEVAPPWMNNIQFFDDSEQNASIEENEKQIMEAKNNILAAQAKLKENAEFESILYTNGEQLVSVVFKILEDLLNYDLSTFVDEKREDFLIKLPHCTFIGEIKGVNTNVKFEHISQLELHYRSYLDRLNEPDNSDTTKKVKQILIINPFRNKPIEQRDAVNQEQINLAIRNGCLIIETYTLLRIYEKFRSNQLDGQQCENVFANHCGLLMLSDFDGAVECQKVV